MVSNKYDDAQCFNAINEYARRNLSSERYEHSFRVAETAGEMCVRFGLDKNLGLIAGIAHDICKEISEQEMLALVKLDGKPVEGLEAKKTSLLHGRCAAVKIQSEFGIVNPDVIEAVRNHTFGMENCCDLAKIIFVADKIEPGRPQSTVEYRENLYSKGIDGCTIAVLTENLEYLEKKGKKAAPASFRWLKQLTENNSKGDGTDE